jgi:hypothetical protein
MNNWKNLSRLFFSLAALVLAVAVFQISLAQDDGEAEREERIQNLIESYEFRPVEDIVDHEFVVQDFASDGSARLPIITNIPVACTVVYGTSETDFGTLTFDQGMTSPTIIDHDPILTGLEPETTYYFRVQGTDDFGVIYLSEVMTFTTPAFETGSNDNLLSPENGAEIIDYSSAFGGAAIDERWGAGNAFDNSQNSAWSSAGDGNDAWIEVRLAQRSRIERVEFWSRLMSDGSSRVESFTITTGDGTVYGPFEVPDAEQAYEFEVEIVAETLRFDVESSTGGNTGAVEIAAYGEPVE